MRFLILIVLISFLLSVSPGQNVTSSPNQNNTPVKRKKIGLVLSGGGARGFAHIGVLKVLEENRIPVDYISGASMGALVGSLYATGRTPAEMERLIETLDWGKLLSGSGTAYDELSYRRREDRRNIPGGITLSGRNARLKLPNSVNPGHAIGLTIDNLFFPYSTIKDFNDFPIPFQCVATDMLNAETVVLKSGSIQQSLRATMAVPAAFAPVEIGDRVLADGGILNNIPTDVVKNMGAETIIVVNIETQIGDRASLDNLIGVLGQTFIIATIENSRRSLRGMDYVIAPDLKNYSSADFDDGKAIIELGYLGAKQKEDLLAPLSLSEEEWQEHLAMRRSRQIVETKPITDFLAIEGAENFRKEKIVREELSEKYTGKPVDKSEIEKDLTELTGTQRFDRLGYELTKKDEKEGLLIRVYDSSERTERNTNLELGFEVNNTQADDTNFNARFRLTFFDFGGYGSEWRNDLSIGSKTLFATEYFRPIGEGGFFVAPKFVYKDKKFNFFQAGERLSEFSFQTIQVGVDLGYILSPESEVRFGYKIGNERATRRIGDPLLTNLSGKFSAFSLEHNYDGANGSQIPTRGIRAKSSLSYYFESPGAEGGFPLAETNFTAFYPIKEGNILFGFGNGGTSFGNDVSPFQQFTLGGLFQVGGFGSEEFRGRNLVRGGFGILREAYALPSFIGGKLYVGGWYEAGSVFNNFDRAVYRQSFTGGTFLETPIGPIFLGGSFAGSSRGKLYFSLGRFF